MSKEIAKALQASYERGHRAGRIEARAELTALWRARVADVLTILQAPIPLPPAKDE